MNEMLWIYCHQKLQEHRTAKSYKVKELQYVTRSKVKVTRLTYCYLSVCVLVPAYTLCLKKPDL